MEKNRLGEEPLNSTLVIRSALKSWNKTAKTMQISKDHFELMKKDIYKFQGGSRINYNRQRSPLISPPSELKKRRKFFVYKNINLIFNYYFYFSERQCDKKSMQLSKNNI